MLSGRCVDIPAYLLRTQVCVISDRTCLNLVHKKKAKKGNDIFTSFLQEEELANSATELSLSFMKQPVCLTFNFD